MKVHVKISLMMFVYMFIIIIILPIYDIPPHLISKEVTSYLDDWEVSLNGQTYNHVTVNKLTQSAVPRVKKGETIQLIRTLEVQGDFDSPALMVTSNCSAVVVKLDNEQLCFNKNPNSNNFFYIPGKSLHLIDLPDDYLGKTLTIELTAEEDLAFSGIIPPMFGERLTLIRMVAYRGLRSILIGIFMSVYGILFVLISAFFSKKVPQIQGQVYAAAICILIGVWMLCYSEVFILLYPGVNTTLMEYFCQFLSVPVFYVFLFRLNMPVKRRWEKIIPVSLSVVSLLILLVWMLIRNYTTLLMMFFIIIIMLGLVLLCGYYRFIGKSRNYDYSVFMQINGVSVMLVACLIQCILYYLQDIRGIPRDVFGRSVMSIGVSTLAVSQMLNFFFLVTRNVADQSGNMSLAEMAYLDSLTGIYNRSMAEEVTQKILHSKDDFCVIMMDLNGLKEVNDKKGHLSGDHLLMEFAQVLRVCIRKSAFYARIGGDEFIIIIENPQPMQAQKMIDSVRVGFQKLDEKDPGIMHSFAAGYATGFEAGNVYNLDAHDRDKIWKHTMKLADSRMYEQKNAMKKTFRYNEESADSPSTQNNHI